ncbi:AraC family transcriptional regulator [Ciceribacter sp. L1K23]|uniref:AraC family transcriptional regulator n=1 Tax=Ciceribacter sp. L1K23 TaxID=2820276 RepID=UPI001B82F3C5|nr:AraC family transcriptional regulator [Ciceribacter sp. L1K23]MBR0554911.1 AraC family transcriptional regulator [Ciceribacter sp. L1K23]
MAHGFTAFSTGIRGLHAVAAESDHVFPRHTHDEFGIGVILDGGQLSASGRGQVEAGPGNVITVNPGEVHDGIPAGGKSRRWTMFYLTPECLHDFAAGFTHLTAPALEFEAPVFRNGQLADRFLCAWRTIRTTDAAGPLAWEEALLDLLAEAMAPPRAHLDRHDQRGIAHARQMIDDDPTSTPTLASLAAETGLSRFQTLRAFAKVTGLTPHAYLLQRRLLLARRLIASGVPLAATAAESGFADQSHLTRAFRRHYGLTPAAFRQATTAIPFKTQERH